MGAALPITRALILIPNRFVSLQVHKHWVICPSALTSFIRSCLADIYSSRRCLLAGFTSLPETVQFPTLRLVKSRRNTIQPPISVSRPQGPLTLRLLEGTWSPPCFTTLRIGEHPLTVQVLFQTAPTTPKHRPRRGKTSFHSSSWTNA